MLALETVHGHRVAASPDAIDSFVAATSDALALRFAPDELFVIGDATLTDADAHAIVVPESGFVGCWLDADELTSVATHIDWPLPRERPALAQGFVAGVPAKLWLTADRSLLLCAAPYAVELAERLS